MAVVATVKGKDYASTTTKHAEEVMFEALGAKANMEVEMNGWPCCRGERHKNCHALFIKKSAGGVITVTITADKGGYAADHGKAFNSTGTITYTNGVAAYS